MNEGAPQDPSGNEPTANPAVGAAPTPVSATTAAAEPKPPSPAPNPSTAAAEPKPAPGALAATEPAPPGVPRLSGEDDRLPDDADVFELSKSAFKKRLDRYSRSQLKQLFGTDDSAEILSWREAKENYEREKEERRLSEMTEAQRLQVQLEKAQASAQHWEGRYNAYIEEQAIRDQDRQMTAVAAKYANPKCMDFLMMEFAKHLQAADPAEIGEPQEYADRWFRTYTEANPEFGVPAAAPPPAPAAVPAAAPPSPDPRVVRSVQVPISNGAMPGGRANAVPSGQMAQKTLVPGQPNSMSDAEAKAWMRQHGYTV